VDGSVASAKLTNRFGLLGKNREISQQSEISLLFAMKAHMNMCQMRAFTKVLRFLARIGNELYFEAVNNRLILRTVNSSKTCYSSVIFLEDFFITYVEGAEDDDNNCRIAMRPLLSILKNFKTVSSTGNF
jgi:hypothetical protein